MTASTAQAGGQPVDRYPKLSEKIHSERNWLRCKADWVAHAIELEREVARLRVALAASESDAVVLRQAVILAAYGDVEGLKALAATATPQPPPNGTAVKGE